VDKTRYAHYNINYHLVWIPKYRRKVLVGTIKADLENFIHEIAEKLEVKIASLEVQPDHIHLFKYPYLKSLPSMWTKTYYVGTAGNVSAEVIKRYIEECQG